MLFVLGVSVRFGAIDFSIADIQAAFGSLLPGHAEPSLNQRIFLELRLPRAILCMLVGASLGVGGTLMQALFRNPIVEPGLVGTSSGAAFGSALFFVLGGLFGNTVASPHNLSKLPAGLNTARLINLSASVSDNIVGFKLPWE